jgi:hypothetical protein
MARFCPAVFPSSDQIVRPSRSKSNRAPSGVSMTPRVFGNMDPSLLSVGVVRPPHGAAQALTRDAAVSFPVGGTFFSPVRLHKKEFGRVPEVHVAEVFKPQCPFSPSVRPLGSNLLQTGSAWLLREELISGFAPPGPKSASGRVTARPGALDQPCQGGRISIGIVIGATDLFAEGLFAVYWYGRHG